MPDLDPAVIMDAHKRHGRALDGRCGPWTMPDRCDAYLSAEALAAEQVRISRVEALLSERPAEIYDESGNFCGFVDGGDHRTVGPHRAWSNGWSEWCYPTSPCDGCEMPVEQVDLREALADNKETA